MKRILLSMLFAAAIFSASTSEAQSNVKINLDAQPQWGPAGYNYAEYYYMPDIETYYNVPRREFVYYKDNKWAFSPNLPPTYSTYDLYSGHKVVLKTPNAYKNYNTHKVQYAKYKNKHGQVNIKTKGNNGNHYGQNKNKTNNGNHYGQNKSNGNNKGKVNGKGKGNH